MLNFNRIIFKILYSLIIIILYSYFLYEFVDIIHFLYYRLYFDITLFTVLLMLTFYLILTFFPNSFLTSFHVCLMFKKNFSICFLSLLPIFKTDYSQVIFFIITFLLYLPYVKGVKFYVPSFWSLTFSGILLSISFGCSFV